MNLPFSTLVWSAIFGVARAPEYSHIWLSEPLAPIMLNFPTREFAQATWMIKAESRNMMQEMVRQNVFLIRLQHMSERLFHDDKSHFNSLRASI